MKSALHLALILLLILVAAACRVPSVEAPPEGPVATPTDPVRPDPEEQENPMTLARDIIGEPNLAETMLDIQVTVDYAGEKQVQVLDVTEQLPAGWTYLDLVDGAQPDIHPAEGAQGEMTFIWLSVPPFPLQFTYRVQTGADHGQAGYVSGQVTYQNNGPELRSDVILTPLEGFEEEEEGAAQDR